MPQVKPQRGARDPSYPPPGQFQAPAAYKSASSRPGRAKARTWVRTKPAEQSTSVNNPTSARIQVAQQSVGSFVSSLSKSIQVNQRGVASTPSQQASYVSSKRNTLTRLQPGFASKAVPKSGSTSQGVSQATRRLIHQGRHKLIQQPKHTSRPQPKEPTHGFVLVAHQRQWRQTRQLQAQAVLIQVLPAMARRPALNVRQAGIAKPGKLQRIDGVLYKVGGSGLGRSLQRQITPKAVRPLLSPEGAYVRQGKHLTLRSMLTTPKAVIQRVSTARSRPSSSAASASISGRQKLAAAARVRRPSRLSKSSKPVQTHCLVFCRTGGRCPNVMPVCTFYLQGLCTTEECPYAHVKVDPNAPVCQEFVSGHCPRGVSCTKKHLTPRMIRQLRQSKALQADPCTSQQSKATLAQARPPEAGQPMLQDEDLDLRPAFLR
ncbi:hypothetical protein WJX79_008990 [Trebouxia sp. C0005]